MRRKVTDLLMKALEKNKSLFLIDLSITNDHKIKVVIDGDQGVSLNDCIDISRAIEHQLDRDETDFSLEVTSAGVTEPLINSRQYQKNIGRKLKVVTQSEEIIEGILRESNPDTIILQWKARENKPVGKGKVTVQKEKILDFKEIKEAKVLITFN